MAYSRIQVFICLEVSKCSCTDRCLLAGEHQELQEQLTRTLDQLQATQQSAQEQEARQAEAQAELERKVALELCPKQKAAVH